MRSASPPTPRITIARGQIRTAFDSAYITADGRVGAPFTNADNIHTEYTQTAAVLALHFGLVPDSIRAQARGSTWPTTSPRMAIISRPDFSAAPTSCRRSPTAAATTLRSLLFTQTFPSWLYEVDQGATTTWERWNGDHGNPEMNSYSHYAFGAVGEWLYRDLGGHRPGVGCRRLRPGRDPSALGCFAGFGARRLSFGAWYDQQHVAEGREAGRRHGHVAGEYCGVVELPVSASAHISADGARAQDSADDVRRYAIDAGTWRFVVAP